MAGLHEGCEREGRITQPAEAVVPVARPADGLWQGGGRRRAQAARGLVGEALEHGERPADRRLPWSRVGGLVRPALPPRLRVGEGRVGVDHVVARLVGRVPREDERDSLAGGHREVCTGAAVLALALAAEIDGRDQAQRIGTGHRRPGAVDAAHPGHDRAVLEPHEQLGAHRHPTPPPLHDAHEVEVVGSKRHAIDDGHLAVVAHEDCLEHERVAAVVPLSPPRRGGRGSHRPCRGSPRRAAKHAAESNRGNVSQSIEPSMPTRAADCMSDRSA